MNIESFSLQPFSTSLNDKTVRLPGSKSISNRALILAALSDSDVILDGLLRSEDTELMLDCLKRLGVGIEELSDTRVRVRGTGGSFPNEQAELYVGTAGTVARLLIGVIGVQAAGSYKIDGSDVMRTRPMKGLTDLLKQVGCEVEFLGAPDALPFILKPRGFQVTELQVDASASSQVLSAVLMAAGLSRQDVQLNLSSDTIRRPYVIMTSRMMIEFGGPVVEWNEFFTRFRVSGSDGYFFSGDAYCIESDASAASYFLTLPFVVGGSLNVYNFDVNGLQGDVAYANVLKSIGAELEVSGKGIHVQFSQSESNVSEYDFYPISDTFMTLAAVSPLLSFPVRISGIAHTRKQESDRVKAMAMELKKLGQKVVEEEDSLFICPDFNALRDVAAEGVEIATYKDHRIAMSFGILGSKDMKGDGSPWMTILDPMCCSKTFPEFFKILTELRCT